MKLKLNEVKPKFAHARTHVFSTVKAVYEAPSFEKTIRWSAILGSITVISIGILRDPIPPTRSRSQISEPGVLDIGPQMMIPQATDYLNHQAQNGSGYSHGDGAGKRGTKLPGPALIARPRNVQIPPGLVIQAVLLSGASNGVVRAKTTEPLSIHGERLIDTDSILVGSGSSTEERLFIHFNQMVTKEGEVVAISGQAIDSSDQTLGLKGSKIAHVGRFMTGAGLLFLGGVAQGFENQTAVNGVAVNQPSVKDALLQGTQNAAVSESQTSIEKMKNETPIIEVPMGTLISVVMTGQGP
jgi:hypothetical protein